MTNPHSQPITASVDVTPAAAPAAAPAPMAEIALGTLGSLTFHKSAPVEGSKSDIDIFKESGLMKKMQQNGKYIGDGPY